MFEVILIWIFCIIVIVIIPIIGLIAFVYISTNAPIDGWNKYRSDSLYKKNDKEDEC